MFYRCDVCGISAKHIAKHYQKVHPAIVVPTEFEEAPEPKRRRRQTWLERVRTIIEPNHDALEQLEDKGPGWHHGGE
jgi:hypothetical protein